MEHDMREARQALVLARDHDPAELRRRSGAGELVRVRRGAYACGASDGVVAARRLARVRVAAVAAQLDLDMCVSHESAALVWGLPTLRVPVLTHVIQRSNPGVRGDRAVRRHVDAVPPSERCVVDGIPVTTLERTTLDCARTMPELDALVIADAALLAGADPHRVLARLQEMHGVRGVRRARRVLALARPGAESARETQLRYLLVTGGLAEPELQVRVATPFGTYRLDLAWLGLHVAVEFDGRVKYDELAAGDPASVLFREKERQLAIEAEGWTVVRVTARDLRDPARLVARIGRVLRHARSVPRAEIGA